MSGEVLLGHEAAPVAGAQFMSDDDPRGAELLKHIQPKGDPNRILGLPRKLEEKRWEYKIVDEAFEYQALFDIVFVHQIPPPSIGLDGKISGTNIYFTENYEKFARQQHPVGVIVSAGAQAQEVMYSHGLELGDTCILMRLSPWRLPVLELPGMTQYLFPLKVGGLIGDRDLKQRMKARECSYRIDKKTCSVTFVDGEGERTPIVATNDPEYG